MCVRFMVSRRVVRSSILHRGEGHVLETLIRGDVAYSVSALLLVICCLVK